MVGSIAQMFPERRGSPSKRKLTHIQENVEISKQVRLENKFRKNRKSQRRITEMSHDEEQAETNRATLNK
jgi:hypothetical protein